MRRREVDGARGFERPYRISDGGSGCGLGDDDGRNSERGKYAASFIDKGLAEEAGIPAHQDPVRRRLRVHVRGNAGNGTANVGDSEFVSDDGAPP